MTSTNTVDEAIGLDLMKTLRDLPITKNILAETRVGRSVNQFHVSCKNKQVVNLGRSLLLSWQKLITDKIDTKPKQDEVHDDAVQPNTVNEKRVGNQPNSHENVQDTVNETMDTIENHESASESNLFIYVKGTHVDITKVSPSRVYKELQGILQRVPKVKQLNRILRITCVNDRESELLIDTQFIAGHEVSCTKPPRKTEESIQTETVELF